MGVTKLSVQNIRGTIAAIFSTFQFMGSIAGSAISRIFWEISSLISVILLSSIVAVVAVNNLKL